MALALYKERTIIIKLGHQRKFTDIDGMNYINLVSVECANATFKTTLNSRLKNCGCDIDNETRSKDWIEFKFKN